MQKNKGNEGKNMKWEQNETDGEKHKFVFKVVHMRMLDNGCHDTAMHMPRAMSGEKWRWESV